ncbi:hypothetical protein Rcae01_06203 [Novipirellula caenicola]|uniref:Uncharacterized protein n=1 Tax=Novipirellula caenicola TaxID=1536901 RepID=A0ABP9W2G1_9BACT
MGRIDESIQSNESPLLVLVHPLSRDSDESSEQDLRASLSKQDLHTPLSLGFPSRWRSFTRNKTA